MVSVLSSRAIGALVGLGLFLPASALACAGCGCTLSSDWESQGFSAASGFRADIRYDYLDQSDLRHGAHAVDPNSIPLPSNMEVERGTTNRYVTATFDYSPNRKWGFNLQLPWLDRSHSTIPEGETDVGTSRTKSFGDMRITARYQGFSPEGNTGIQFGLKLPTGAFHKTFATGPEAGSLLDRGLQPGSGTTDLILGAYHFNALNRDFDYFLQGQLQVPIASREAYRPGVALSANAGVRYMGSAHVVPQIQINARTAAADRGAQADAGNSGGTLVYLSPGVTLPASAHTHLYAFLQLPLFQYVKGYQLTPKATFTIGMRQSF